MLTQKMNHRGGSCASIFIHAEHVLSSRNRDGDECCIYLSFTSWYANIMRSAHQITKVCMNTDSVAVFSRATGAHAHTQPNTNTAFRIPLFFLLLFSREYLVIIVGYIFL